MGLSATQTVPILSTKEKSNLETVAKIILTDLREALFKEKDDLMNIPLCCEGYECGDVVPDAAVNHGKLKIVQERIHKITIALQSSTDVCSNICGKLLCWPVIVENKGQLKIPCPCKRYE